MYSIIGASGQIGRRIAERLVLSGREVRVIARHRDKLADLEKDGAELRIGDVRDPEFLAQTFAGAEAVFAMIPPAYGVASFRDYQGVVGRAIVYAVEQAGVKHVVNLSSVGAHLESGTGPILGLHDQEERLNQLQGVNVLHLRPTYFMENLLSSIPGIESRGILETPLRGDVRFPAIATRDIAEVATERLLRLDFRGKVVRTLLGERDVTMNEITKAIGYAIHRPDLPYAQVPYEVARQSMIETGCSADVAHAMLEMLRGMNEGLLIAGTPRAPESTTATSIEEFAKEFAVAYAAAAHRARAA